jgi:signal transduction histidine kinase
MGPMRAPTAVESGEAGDADLAGRRSRCIRHVVVAGAVAVALTVAVGVFLPQQIERRIWRSELDADRSTLAGVVARARVPPANARELAALDRLTRNTILRGDYVSVKLWGADGTVLYSDDSSLIGEQFPVEGGLATALSGATAADDVSKLDRAENASIRDLADRVLEVYVPISRDGHVVAVWEVYRSLDRFDTAMGEVRRTVWLTVGGALVLGLVVLAAVQWRVFRDLARSERTQRRLTRDLVDAHEVERRTIVGEIHDGIGQSLHRILFGLRRARSHPDAAPAELEKLEPLVERSITDLRRVLRQLSPTVLDDLGLVPAVRSLATMATDDGQLVVDVTADDALPNVDGATGVAVYRIVQEALHNAVKHGHAEHAAVDLHRSDGMLVTRIEDDGSGYEPQQSSGLGVWLMHERAEAVGGTLDVWRTSSGTAVEARIPIGAPQ